MKFLEIANDVKFEFKENGPTSGSTLATIENRNPFMVQISREIIGRLDWEKVGDLTQIEMIYVYPEFRRKGIARQLIDSTKKHLGISEFEWGGTTEDGSKLKQALGEAGRLFSAITLGEIPQKYKKLKVLGRGTTSVVAELDSNWVIMFTRDAIKKDWLVNELEVADMLDTYDTRHPKFPELSEKSIYILKMPRFYPLSLENKRKIKKVIKHINSKYHRSNQSKLLELMRELEDQNIVDKIYGDQKESLEQLYNFLANYDETQYAWDIETRNIMQTGDGKIVVLDPIVDKEIIDIFYNSRRNKKRI